MMSNVNPPRLPQDHAWQAHFLDKLDKFVAQYPRNQRLGRAFRIVLSSNQRASGTLTAATFNIKIPHALLSERLNISVETFIHSTAPSANGNVDVYPTLVSLAQLRNPYSWSSADGLQHGVIAVTGNRTYINHAPRSTAGSTLIDRSFFERPVTVTLSSPHYDVTAANGVANDWTCVLTLWDAGSGAQPGPSPY